MAQGDLMTPGNLEAMIRAQAWVADPAGTCWQDGLIQGNGDLGVITYAPYGLEWVINKGDVFDSRESVECLLPHQQVMERFRRERPATLQFLGEAGGDVSTGVSPRSKSAAVLRLHFGEEFSWAAARPHAVTQQVNLWDGDIETTLDMHLSHPRVRSITPRHRHLLCLRLQHSGAALWNHTVELVRPPDDALDDPIWQVRDGCIGFVQRLPGSDASYAVAITVVPGAGPEPDDLFNASVHPRYRRETSTIGVPQFTRTHGWLPQSGNADVYLAIYTSYEIADPLAAAFAELHQATEEGFTTLAQANSAWWHEFWQRGWADFGAQRDIQRYYAFSLYETACFFGTAPMGGLYGLWYGPTDTPSAGIGAAWYTHDQNVQIPAMPLLPVNHPELLTPFADTYRHALSRLRTQTRQVFGRGGIYLPLTMNQLGADLTTGPYRYSLCGGAYTGLLLIWWWRYTRDQKALRASIYPLLREIVQFYVEGMTRGEDGRFHLDWEVPPEIGTMSRDSLVTLALLKPCLETALEASRLFEVDGDRAQQWAAVLADYPEFPRHPSGAWRMGADVHPDHMVQGAYLLYPFFPAEAVGADSEALQRTLETLTDHDVEISYADIEGRWHYKRCWSWFFPAATRVRRGDPAGWGALQECLRAYAKPNGLFTHNAVIIAPPAETERNLAHIPQDTFRHADGVYAPRAEAACHDSATAGTLHPFARRWVAPVVEGSGAFLFAAAETLLQSHGGVIQLFPCVPQNFTGGFYRFLAQNNVEVSAEMRHGAVTWFALRTPMTQVVRLRNPWPGDALLEIVLPADQVMRFEEFRGQTT